MAPSLLLQLPHDILISLPEYLSNIEDFTNLSSTCRALRWHLASTPANRILRLAAAQESTFFRPAPFYLLAATARELGTWARASLENEAQLAESMCQGIEGLLPLALEHCGLTLQRIRDLHAKRFTLFNPVIAVFWKGVEEQNLRSERRLPEDDEDTDPGTVAAEADEIFFLLAIYGELFGPDLAAAMLPADASAPAQRPLSVDTRMEYMKYCIPGWSFLHGDHEDPRVAIKSTGPYVTSDGMCGNPNWGLLWILQSRRWRREWMRFRRVALPDEGEGDSVEHDLSKYEDLDWRQQLWLNVLWTACGIEGLGMISPAIPVEERVQRWAPVLREWRARIAALDERPERTHVGTLSVPVIPVLQEDLWVMDGTRAR